MQHVASLAEHVVATNAVAERTAPIVQQERQPELDLTKPEPEL